MTVPPRKRLPRPAIVFVLLVALCLCGPFAAGAEDFLINPQTPVYACRLVKAYPHDPLAFTQGLVFYGGYLYESTGLYGRSSLRKVNLATGRVLKIRRLPGKYFGEGITLWKDRIVLLTWQSHKGFIYDRETFRQTGQFTYGTEGWGMTFDGAHFIMSDGTPVLQFLEPGSFKVVKRMTVHESGRPVTHLNELEVVKGEVFANIWETNYIARISPDSGKVTGWIDLGSLYAELGDAGQAGVPNGIAYDPDRDRLFVTGKNWPKLFEVRLVRQKAF